MSIKALYLNISISFDKSIFLFYHLYMTNSHLLILLQEAKMSPEALAGHMGVSNMTIRRLLEKPPQTQLSKLHRNALAGAIYKFIAKGIIAPESKLTAEVVKQHIPAYFDAAAKLLDIPKDFNLSGGHLNQERLIFWLSEMGSNKKKEIEVDDNLKKISQFKRWGKEWSFRICTLLDAVRSKKYSLSKRFVAYGALFYLICPFDLIPDAIPVIGYMDDFLILGLAATYILSGPKDKMS